jgi:peptide chain release factor subunit 1
MASVSGAVELPAVLRRLAGVRAPKPQVLSLYLNLDPFEVPTAPARATAINALLDEAGRVVDERDDELDHAGMVALRQDLETVRERLEGRQTSLEGGKAFAIFRCSPLGLDETLPLPRPVRSRVVVDSAPFLEPLLQGTRDRLEELTKRRDPVHGQHDQGGWSQPNYERSIEQDVLAHLQRSADALRQIAAQAPFDHLVLGGPHELVRAGSARLPAELRDRLVGWVEVDVENSTPTEVLAAVTPTIEAFERDEERRRLDRLIAGASRGGRGTAGLEPTLTALNERRVELLAFEDGFTAAGRLCPRCGWLGPEGVERCPIDGGSTDAREDIVEDSVLAAFGQSADVLVVRHHPDLGPLGRIGAILRF